MNPTFIDENRHKADTNERTDSEMSDSQSSFNLIYCSDSICAVSIGDSGILLSGVVAKQQDLLAVEGVFRPGDVRQRAGGAGIPRVVGVLMVDEVN